MLLAIFSQSLLAAPFTTLDDAFFAIAEESPRFAGAYVKNDDLMVKYKDASKLSASQKKAVVKELKPELLNVLGSAVEDRIENIKIDDAKYSFSQLYN